jgi:hypothetical protein
MFNTGVFNVKTALSRALACIASTSIQDVRVPAAVKLTANGPSALITANYLTASLVHNNFLIASCGVSIKIVPYVSKK